MKLKTLISTATISLVASAMPLLNAAFSYSPGDLFLGFRQIGNNTADFTVNIGQANLYRDALAPITLTLTGLQATLNQVSVFGTGWQTNSNTQWGVVGTTQSFTVTTGSYTDPIRTIYSSQTAGGTAPINGSSNAQSAPANSIIGMITYYQGAGSPTITENPLLANSSVGGPSDTSSWTARVSVGQPFSYSNIGPLEGVITSNLDLFRVPTTNGAATNNTVTREGTFSLSGDVLTFTPVPEPSTNALVAIALGGLGFYLFKRKKAAV